MYNFNFSNSLLTRRSTAYNPINNNIKTASTVTTGQTPFVLQNGTNLVDWTSSNKPQLISYNGNIYQYNSQDRSGKLLYTATKKLPQGQNNLRLKFTGKSEQQITGYTTERVQTGTNQVQIGTEKVQTGTEKVQTGTEQYQTGTQQVQVGTEKVQTGTEQYQTGTQPVQVGTEKVLTGTRISGYNTRVETGNIDVNRELDGKDNAGAVGNILNAENSTALLLDASKANSLFTTEAAKFKVGSLLGEDNQSNGKNIDILKKVEADDMYVAGDPVVGGKGNNYNADTITPGTGFITMHEDGLDTGQKSTINAHVDTINAQGNKAFTEYGFVVQDDAGQKTTATLSGGQLLINGQALLPGQEKVIGNPSDPVAKFYYTDMPGGKNGTAEKRLVFESYEKVTPETRQKLLAAGADPAQVDALRSKYQSTFGFRIPDGNDSYRSSAGVTGGLPVTSNGVKTYYDAHFSEPPSFNLPTKKEYQDPIYESVYTDKPIYEDKPTYGERPVYTDKPIYEDKPIYKEVPVYENRQKPVYGTKYEIKKALSSPLVLDLDGDGIETTPQTKKIDIDGDGTLDSSSWFGTKEGVLTFDANKNGKIDLNGTELFGDNSDVDGDGKGDNFANGFDALRKLSSQTLGAAATADNILDANEIKALEIQAGLRMMINNQAKKLSEAGVNQINLNYNNINQTDAYGNEFRQQSAFQRVLDNGEVVNRDITDVWLNSSPLQSSSAKSPLVNGYSNPQAVNLQSLISQMMQWFQQFGARTA